MSRFLTLLVALSLITSYVHAGVYGPLEFGDNRDTVIRKLNSSNLVTKKVADTFLGRTGLNGIYECTNKLAGMTYFLYFGWDDRGGLTEITLRSEEISGSQYNTKMKDAWNKANDLFTNVYEHPVQAGDYPEKSKFKSYPILMTHMWHKGSKQTIMIGPGLQDNKTFLNIRFVNQKIEPIRIP